MGTRQFSRLTPAWRGAVLGAAGVTLAFAGYLGAHLHSGLGRPADVLLALLLGAATLCLASSALLGARALLDRIPPLVRAVLGAGVIAFLVLLGLGEGVLGSQTVLLSLMLAVLLGTVGVSLFALLGGAVGVVLDGHLRQGSSSKRLLAGGLVAVALALNAWGAWWFFGTGTAFSDDVATPPANSTLVARDPAAPGPHGATSVRYGPDAALPLRTPTVDARSFIGTGWTGWRGRLRTRYWHFDGRTVPLAGQMWLPGGAGAFPVVMIVHGNHRMEQPSESGYAYLGELLASRGYVTVSVDENFLNTAWFGELHGENAARGWLLLEHLRIFREWNATDGHPLFGRLDLGRVALIGHSRGGEAVAIASALNRLAAYPDDATVRFDYGFGIRALIAIAPTEGQYRPAGRPVTLENVSYLLLQGSQDGDVTAMMGMRQFHRVRFTGEGDHLKAAVFIDRANHGAFNTVWGRDDQRPPMAWLLNRRPLMDGEAQRQVARVYVSAFLDVVLRGDSTYLPVLRDHRAAASWLPKTRYVTRFLDSATHVVADFEEDLDPATTSARGGSITGAALDRWKETAARLRDGSQEENQVVSLAWTDEAAGAASYTVGLPAGTARRWGLDLKAALTFAAADARAQPAGTIDFTVELLAGEQSSAAVTVTVAPSPLVKVYRLGLIERALLRPRERMLQSYAVPLAAFGPIDPERITAIRFRFNRTSAGAIYLDDVGFRRSGR